MQIKMEIIEHTFGEFIISTDRSKLDVIGTT
jgi:hypothetical protein